MSTVICHIFNEEMLLPFWLKHHRTMFDHGIIIDYKSTDSSCDIVRDLVPSWDLVQSRNEYFVEPAIGNEVEDYESQISGWKMVLNVTEFLICDLNNYCSTLEEHDIAGICTNGVVIVDNETDKLDPNISLVKQKTYGYFEKDVLIKPSTTRRPVRSRSRLLHRSDRGRYSLGRHSNSVTNRIDPNLFLCWFGWCPFGDKFRSRKLQIQTKVSDNQKEDKNWSEVYVLNSKKLEDMYQEELARSYDLTQFENYSKALDLWHK